MHWDWIALSGVQAAGWVAVLLLMRRERRRMRATVSALAASLAELKQTRVEPEAPVELPLESLDLTRRAQAIRMQRKGEPLPAIAGAVRTPRNEIELLVKVQQYLGS